MTDTDNTGKRPKTNREAFMAAVRAQGRRCCCRMAPPEPLPDIPRTIPSASGGRPKVNPAWAIARSRAADRRRRCCCD